MRWVFMLVLLLPLLTSAELVPVSCLSDSDGGIDPTVSGTTILSTDPSTVVVEKDWCQDGSTVLEWYCSESAGLSTTVKCAYGCQDGACLPVPEVTACNDGRDSDQDGLVDFPYDPGCACVSDTDERDDVDNGEIDCSGMVADSCPDGIDVFGRITSPDTDGDGLTDDCDNCPLVPNIDQEDTDSDGVGDECIQTCVNECVPDGYPFCSSQDSLAECVLQQDGCTDVIVTECVLCTNTTCQEAQ